MAMGDDRESFLWRREAWEEAADEDISIDCSALHVVTRPLPALGAVVRGDPIKEVLYRVQFGARKRALRHIVRHSDCPSCVC